MDCVGLFEIKVVGTSDKLNIVVGGEGKSFHELKVTSTYSRLQKTITARHDGTCL